MKASVRAAKGHIRNDILASLVVFIIAVPLSLGIALASGMPPVAALVAAVVGGVVVGALSGAPIVVSGPAAGLSALVLTYAHDFGIESVYRITMMAGVLQLIFGVLRLGRFISLIPKTLLEGVLSAIGLTIMLSQLHILMGQAIPGGAAANIMQMPHSFMMALHTPSSLGMAPALVCGLLALIIQLMWPILMKRASWIPAALPAVLIGTAAALSWEMPRVKLAAMIPHITQSVQHLMLANLWQSWIHLFIPAIGLALVASAESLLTARAVDVLVSQKHGHLKTNMEKELVAQGVGNIVCGSLGGMPLTGVMVRSAANFNAGASSRLSTVLHGVIVGLSVLVFPSILEYIPLSVLASVLVLTGWKLLSLKSLIPALRYQFKGAYLWPLTTIAILATDLLRGFAFAIAYWLVSAALIKRKKRRQDEAQAEEAAA